MKVLVTGGAGFIGSQIVKTLEAKGSKVIILDDFSHADYKNIVDCRAEVISDTILNESLFKKLPFDCAIIISSNIWRGTP